MVKSLFWNCTSTGTKTCSTDFELVSYAVSTKNFSNFCFPFFTKLLGMRASVVGKSYGSWKEQLGKTRSWKVWHEIGKDEVGKLGLKFEGTTEFEKF